MATKWTHFWDMHSGGSCKESPYDHIYIEAQESEARIIFYNRFGHNPDRVTCTCCGEDYSVDESDSLEQATGYERGCAFIGNSYIEMADGRGWKDYITIEDFKKKKDILIIYENEIKPSERQGDIPEQGYVWID